MKKILANLFVFALLLVLFTACNGQSLNVQSIFIKAINEDVFSNQNHIYYHNPDKKDKLALKAILNKNENFINLSNDNKINVSWSYFKSDNITKNIKDWKNSKQEQIAELNNDNLIINLAQIDILEDYTIVAKAGNVEGKYTFSVDSKDDINSSISLYYTPFLGADIKKENQIILNKDNTHLSLNNGENYILKVNDNDSFGQLEFVNKTPDVIRLYGENENKTNNLQSNNNTIYLSVVGKQGDDGLVEIKAGNKKISNVFIKIDSPEMTTISLPAPIVDAIAIQGGYKFIFKAEDNKIFEDYALMLKIDNNDPFQVVDEYYINDCFEGLCYNHTHPGAFKMKAYFQRQNFCSQSFNDTFMLVKDNLLDKRNKDESLFEIENEIKIDFASWNEQKNCKIIKFVFPGGGEYRLLPLKDNIYFYPYKAMKAKITLISDNVQYFDVSLNFNSQTEWSCDIPDGLLCDKIILKVQLYNIYGKALGDEKEYEINNRKFNVDSKFVYICDDEESLNKSRYGIAFSALGFDIDKSEEEKFKTILENETYIAYTVSQDRGETFSDVEKHLITQDDIIFNKTENGGFLFAFPNVYLKNSDEVIIKTKLLSKGVNTYNFPDVSTSALMACEAVKVEFDNTIQDAPNVKKAKISAPKDTTYQVYYSVNNSSHPANSEWIKLDFGKNEKYKIIDAIKYNSNELSTQISKTLWVKTCAENDTNISPSLNSYKITLSKAPRPMSNKSDGILWCNRGFWHGGIAIMLHSPMDNCYIRAIGETENVYSSRTVKFEKMGDKIEFVNDFDQCFAGYRYNRFFITGFTRAAGFIDSEIDEYCGYERSGYSNDFSWCHKKSTNAIEELKKTWRKSYVFE